MIDGASQELQERLNGLLKRERLEPAGAISHLDTPRRLAVLAPGIPAAQPDVTEQVTGLPLEPGTLCVGDGAVRYRESGPDLDRRVNADTLDVGGRTCLVTGADGFMGLMPGWRGPRLALNASSWPTSVPSRPSSWPRPLASRSRC